MNEKEKHILEEIGKGNAAAYKELFQEYYLILCHFTEKYVLELAVAEDIVQEILIKVWEKRETLVISTSLKSYLFQTAKNQSLNFLKHSMVQKKYEAHKMNTTTDHFYYEALEEEELNYYLYKSLELLPPKCRQVFEMSRLQDKSHDEIVDQMGITKKTINNQLGKAFKIIHQFLTDNEIITILLFLLALLQ